MFFWILPIAGFGLFALNEIANPRGAFSGRVLWKGSRRGVALTFDDGPHPLYTRQALDILDSYRAKATFFVIGRHLEKGGDLVASASRAGHLVGNHSYHHFRMMSFFSKEKMKGEILRCQSEVEKWTGYRPRFYRQPAGFRNPKIFGILRSLGMEMVGWQARAFDTQARTPETIARRILERARPGGTILLHDGCDSERNQDRRATIEALPIILKGLKDRAMEFLTLEEMFEKQSSRKARERKA